MFLSACLLGGAVSATHPPALSTPSLALSPSFLKSFLLFRQGEEDRDDLRPISGESTSLLVLLCFLRSTC